jgi:molybdopterin synthase catalytic subunit
MYVKVRYYALFREITKCFEEDLLLDNSSSLNDLLNKISLKYPKLGKYLESGMFIVLHNQQAVSDKDLKTILRDGDVVDLMPPPSGGSIEVRLLKDEDKVVLDDVMNELKGVDGIEEAGAVVIYVGFVKGVVSGVKVYELKYEVNEDYTLKAMNKILSDVVAKNKNIKAVKVFHRVGTYRPGDDVLYVFVVGVSRHDVIPALTEIIERIKHETGIWKLERRGDGYFWVLGDGVRIKSEVE